jgi:autonomous glycyl radical cofactor GrcA
MDTYIYKGGRSDGHIYTIRLNNRPPLKQRGKIRRTNINTKGEDQTDTYIYTIRLNSTTPLKQRGKIRRTYIYTKGKI